MEIIDEDQLQTAAIEIAKEKEESIEVISEQFETTLDKMKDPINSQKELAANLKLKSRPFSLALALLFSQLFYLSMG